MRRRFRFSANGRAHRGFSLVELLVSISVIGVLVSLVLPAVQQAREAARRAQCRNNLKQIGLAFHNFHDVHNALPSVDLADSWATWAVLVLPYLDQANLYNKWNLKQRYYRQPLSAGVDLPIFHCPSRTFSGGGSIGTPRKFSDGFFFGPPGWSDYGACWGTKRGLNNGAVVRALDQGTNSYAEYASNASAFEHPGWKFPVSFRNLDVDGATKTLLVGEMHIPPGGKMDVVFNGDTQVAYARVAGHDGPKDPVTGRYAEQYPLIANPNDIQPGWFEYFGSAHSGICQFVLGDGSVRALSVNINLEVLHALAQREDGQPVAEF